MTWFGWVDGIMIDRWTILRRTKKEEASNVAVKVKNELNSTFVLCKWFISTSIWTWNRYQLFLSFNLNLLKICISIYQRRI